MITLLCLLFVALASMIVLLISGAAFILPIADLLIAVLIIVLIFKKKKG